MSKFVLSGATGRMGRAITLESLNGANDIEIVGALGSPTSKYMGKDIGVLAGDRKMGVPVVSDISGTQFDVMIDFSLPEALESNLDLCVQQQAAIMIGTTGLTEYQNELISVAADSIPVLFAANTSVGVNLCAALVEMAAKVLGDISDIEIIEAHHKYKVDAPSGTALLLGEAAAAGAGIDFPDCGVFSREGYTGERKTGSIGFSTIRGGNIPGEHTVMFIGENERLEITHRATDRKIFAQGALHGALWLSEQEKGLYSMQDALDLR
jgi:4-hydroxy-tetrahydrodipicolinate reductase